MRGTQIKQADEVRVFAHDAKPVVIGAVNTNGGFTSLSLAGKGYNPSSSVGTTGGSGAGLTVNTICSTGVVVSAGINAGGSGYTAGVYEVTGGSGTGLKIFASVSLGAVTSITVNAQGSGYLVGDVVTLVGGNNDATVDVDALRLTDIEINAPGNGYAIGDTITISGGIGIGTDATFDIANIDIPGTENRGVCLYVGTAGNIQVEMESGETPTFNNVPAGTFMPVLVKRLVSGSDVLALY